MEEGSTDSCENSERISGSRSSKSIPQKLPNVQQEMGITNVLHDLMDLFRNRMEPNEQRHIQQYEESNKRQEAMKEV